MIPLYILRVGEIMKKEKYLFLEKNKLARIKEDLLTPYTLPFEQNYIEEEKEPSGSHCFR